MDISLDRDSNGNLQLSKHEVFVILDNIRYNRLNDVPDKIHRDINSEIRELYFVFMGEKNSPELDALVKIFNTYADVKYTYKHNFQLERDYVSGYNVSYRKPQECLAKVLDIAGGKNKSEEFEK